MFGWGRAAGRARAVAGIAQGLPARLEGVGMVERATVLILSNSFLALVASMHGSALAADPRQAGAGTVDSAVDMLLPALEQLAFLLDEPALPRRKHVECHRDAVAVALCSVGLGNDPALLPSLRATWKLLWGSKTAVMQAVEWIRRYEKASGVEALPRGVDGEIPSNSDLLRLGGSVPEFLRRKR